MACASGLAACTAWMHIPVAIIHTRNVLSSLVVTANAPFGLKTEELTASVWPVRVWTSRPLAASQTRARRSSLAVSTVARLC